MASQPGQIFAGGSAASPSPFFSSGSAMASTGPVPNHVAGEVEHEAVVLARGGAHAAAGHLDVEPGGGSRPQHCDEVGRRRVEAGGEHPHTGQRPHLARPVGAQEPVALGPGRLAGHRLGGDAVGAQLVAHRPRVIDRDAEGDPGAPVAAELDDLCDRGPGGVAAEAVEHLALDELAHAAVQTGGVERRGGTLGDERGERATLDQHADGNVIGAFNDPRIARRRDHRRDARPAAADLRQSNRFGLGCGELRDRLPGRAQGGEDSLRTPPLRHARNRRHAAAVR